jgi:flagellar motor switch protein FliN
MSVEATNPANVAGATLASAGAAASVAVSATPAAASTTLAGAAGAAASTAAPVIASTSAAAVSTKHSAGAAPSFAKNLLNVSVPVSVTLASKKQSIKQIIDLASGSLIQFDKPCDQTLDLCVGEHCIAQGVAVKVGEKFGLRINQLTPPGERFRVVQRGQ